ncbi:MAG TPA: LuxR C-terminal-related transcriptional regulator [Polyangiaceae bacterium]|nr:LuxR C-terminal-related transcriptional regulator [Polyangiaceae bacterium]
MSSISVHLSNALAAVGGGRSPSQCSILLVMAAHASAGYLQPRLSLRGCDDQARLTLGARTPGELFRARLTVSEWEVARLAIEGVTTQGIVERRHACPRTIANQFASIYQKLRVSGRAALRALAVVDTDPIALEQGQGIAL